MSLETKNSHQRKRIVLSKEALQSAPYKAAKITGFSISLFLSLS
jgi:hypothetical protein